ncbi:MAG: hypothetical protein KDC64_06725 [Aequorivita sp.]|nr:hypothetical protein [Aequorivita sp.]
MSTPNSKKHFTNPNHTSPNRGLPEHAGHRYLYTIKSLNVKKEIVPTPSSI